MKIKDLIAALQEADPSGEIECCVGNVDIWYVALKRNGVVIFDKRRFEDKEFLSLLV